MTRPKLFGYQKARYGPTPLLIFCIWPCMKMVCVELKPNLSSCIETLSKKEYERTLNLLLKEGCVDEGLMEKLEILRLFLESTDFGRLRSQYEGYLTEGKKVAFLIYPEEGKVSYKLMVE